MLYNAMVDEGWHFAILHYPLFLQMGKFVKCRYNNKGILMLEYLDKNDRTITVVWQ